MSKTIDARGLSCPQPVLMTLDAIKSGEASEMIVLVDNEASRENVSRAAASKGWVVAGINEEEGVFRIVINKE
ncbi:MAG: sulfurtransferase TusA family protein [Syntrophales bacterium]|jgi:TusA-related sulfurtransferase|nr:sulfurtransferase TusA family protein [Syntrophales bacterium]MCK9527944.1 sulfurtransferase TusA family protein [Syntrophales bacterium]MDX9921881.1 sulfurtransferase TusA family protein [Syntrophales bacterium]